MGINTFNSLPGMLPKRKHIVLTSKNITLNDEITICHSIEEVLELSKKYDELMIIGGASIYKQFLKYANKLILTEIEAEDKEADTYFPEFNRNEWKAKVIAEHNENDIKYKHIIYTKKH